MNIYIYKIAFDNSQDLIMWQDALKKDLIIWCTELWLVNNLRVHASTCYCQKSGTILKISKCHKQINY